MGKINPVKPNDLLINDMTSFYEMVAKWLSHKVNFCFIYFFFVTQKKKKRKEQKKTKWLVFFFNRLANGNIPTTITTKEEDIDLLRLNVLSKTNIIYETYNDKFVNRTRHTQTIKRNKTDRELI